MLIKLWICLETSLSSRFMSIVLWIRMTHLVPNACCGWGAWCHSLCFEAFLSLMSSLLIRLPWWLRGKASVCSAGDPGLSPGSGRSPGEGNANPLQYSCLGNPMDRGAWRATVHGVTKELGMTYWVNNKIKISFTLVLILCKVEYSGFGARQTWIQSWLYHFLAVGPEQVTSLSEPHAVSIYQVWG